MTTVFKNVLDEFRDVPKPVSNIQESLDNIDFDNIDFDTVEPTLEPTPGLTELDNIDFNSDVSVLLDRGPGIRTEPVQERSWLGRTWDSALRSLRDEDAERVKNANAVAMAEELGIKPSEAYDILDDLSKEVGLRGQPTFQELIEGLMMGGVVVGLLAAPLATAIGVGTFMALGEIENVLVSGLAGIEYEFGAGKGLQELLPEGTSQRIKDLVWTVDMAWKALAGGGIGKTITPKLYSGAQNIYTRFVREASAKYNLPKDIHISPTKIREFHGRGRIEVISRAENDMLKELGLTRQQYKDALKQGIDIKIPAEKIITAVDKPWWGAIKKMVGARPYKYEFARRAEPVVKTHMERLAPPARSVPKAPAVRPADVPPEYEFVSKKGHRYEKIGDKWYNSKGKEVTNKFVLKSAEKSKAGFEDVDAVLRRVGEEKVEEFTGIAAKQEAEMGLAIDELTQAKFDVRIDDPVLVEPLIEPETIPDSVEEKIFRQNPVVTKRNLEQLPKYEKIDTPDALVARIENEINSELDGEIDATPTRQLLSQLSESVKLWASGEESPAGIFEDMGLDELSNLSEYLGRLDEWAKKVDSSKIERTAKTEEIAKRTESIIGPVYHATRASFDKFDIRYAKDKLGIETGEGLGPGKIYFSKLKKDAIPQVGKGDVRTIEAYLDIHKLISRDEYIKRIGEYKTYKEREAKIKILDDRLIKEGYEGVEGKSEVAVFDTSKIYISEPIEPTVELYSGIPVGKAVDILKNTVKNVKGRWIKSVNSDRKQILKDIVKLHLDGKIDADMTYSIGSMWEGTGLEPRLKFDNRVEREGVIKADITKGLPVEDNSITSIMFDPPFIVKGKPEQAGFIGKRFTVFKSVNDLWKFHKTGVEEAFRVLEPGGKLVTKTQDVSPGKGIFASSSEIYNFAIKAGFRAIDRFIYENKNPAPAGGQRKGKVQRLARKVHSDFWVFEKPKQSYTYPSEGGVTLRMGIPLDKFYDKLTSGRKKKKINLPSQPPSPFPTVKEEAREIVFERSGRLNLANYETSKFVSDIEQKTTEKQREALPFVLEKTPVPKEFKRPDLQKTINKNKKHLESVSGEIKQWFNLSWRNIKKHIPDLTVKQIEDYVTHLWDIPKHKKAEAVAWFSTQNRFLERRFIPTYAEGIKKGFKPRTLDINEIIKIHDGVTNRAIENTRYIKSLLAMERDGVPLISRSEDAPLDWIEVDYPALTRRIPLKKGQVKKKGEFVKESKVRVHPDLVRPLKAIFEERFDHPVISAYEAINGIIKKAKLSLSLFHHGALGETGIALIGPAKTAGIYFNPVKVYKALARGETAVFAKEAIARDSILHGVQYGATADIPISRIQGYLDNMAKATRGLPVANRLTSFLKGANSVWDKALWSYLHDTLKLYGYESLVGKMNPSLDAEVTRMEKREIAQLVNDTFGGQNWDTLMMTPKEVQMMTWTLLSADWTVSTTRQALAPTGIGKVYKGSSTARKKMGLRFWARAGLYFGIGMNLLNALHRNKDMEENPQYYGDKDYTFIDKTMFGNTIGKKTYLFNGRYEDGTERYVRWGKQFRDFFELFVNPPKKIGGKIAPVPQLFSEIFTGHTLSGFKNDDIYGTEGLEKAKGIVKTIVKSPLPISVVRYMKENIEFKPLDVMMQSTKGMSRYSAMEYFKKAIIEGDEDTLRDVYVGAIKNNLPAYTLFTAGLSWAEAEATSALAETVKEIEEIRAKLSTAESASNRRRYGKILGRLEKERADKRLGLILYSSAVSRARIYKELEFGRDLEDEIIFE